MLTHHRSSGDDRLVHCVGPVLDADMAAEERVVGAGDVPGGEDRWVGGAQVLVDHDPVVDVQAAGHGDVGVRSGAHADDDKVGVDLGPGFQDDGARRGIGGSQDAVDLLFESEIDPVLQVQVSEDLRDAVAEHACEGKGRAFDHCHFEAPNTCGGGDLEADPAATDHGDGVGRVPGVAQAIGVLHSPQ